ncbi:MAG: T9SS type A sorting domain-containing protein [Bacteroidota bacterium]
MKRFLTVLLMVISVSGLSQAQYKTVWEKSKAAGSLPTYMGTANTERGFAYGNGHVYLVSRKSGNNIVIIDAAKGDSLGTLKVPSSVVTGGTLAINDAEVSEDGVIFAANLSTGTGADTLFKVYKWTSESADPVKVAEYKTKGTPAIRLGDKFTVTGKASDNTLAIWAVQASGTKVIKFATADNGNTFTTSEITLASAAGGSASIAPIGDGSTGFYINGGGVNAVQYDAAGALVGTISGTLVATGSNAIRYFESAARKYIVTYNFGAGNENLRVVDVTDGAKNATRVYPTKSIGTNANANGTGDVAIKRNGTTVDLFILSTNNGMAAYKFYAPLTLSELKVDADKNFVPDLKVTGDTVYVKGVVFTPNIGSATRSSYYMADGTGGVNFYSTLKNFNFDKGDSVSVIGKLDHYNGLAEIVPIDTSSVVVIKKGAVEPAAAEVTLADIKANGEAFESALYTVKNLNKVSGTWPTAGNYATLKVSDGKDTLDLYINKYTDLSQNTEPVWPQDVTGMVTQFIKTAPYNSGYQIYPRTYADFKAAVVPVELTSFAASVKGSSVSLKWQTATEINNSGFEIYRDGVKIRFIKGAGTSTEKRSYSYSDENLANGNYSYKLVQVDLDGTKTTVGTTEAAVSSLPAEFALSQNYPNPFNPSTVIKFALPGDAKVSLKVFNLLGEEVANILNKDMAAGNHEVRFNASNLNSGIYFYTIEAKSGNGQNFRNTKKMVLVK